MNIDRLMNLENKLIERINVFSKEILVQFPAEHYINCLNSYPQIISYEYVSDEIKELYKRFIAATNTQVSDLYHQLILITLIHKAESRLCRITTTRDVMRLFYSNFERIVSNIESESKGGSYNYLNNSFCKDLALCNLRLIPAGAQKIHLDAISKKFLLKKGPLQFMRGLIFLSLRLGGSKPLYQMHTDINDRDLMSEFNPEGWIRFYKRVSDLLKLDKKVKGLFGSSWFFDPQLEKISPRLKYLREIPTRNGAKLFYLGPSTQSTRDALLKSETRRELYEEGKYAPVSYLLVWSRRKILQWANRHK